MHISTIQIGQPRHYGVIDATDPKETVWYTATYKTSVPGPVELRLLGLKGDGQADLQNHGGVDKAVLAYAADHYPTWQAELGIPEFTNGALGENLSVVGGTEKDVCIGDRYQLGSSADAPVVEVSQPRQPCWKQARRWDVPTLVPKIQKSGRTGWYFRVIREGLVASDAELVLLERPNPEWTIDRANRIFYFEKHNATENRALAAVPKLSRSWKNSLAERF
jgi:MOSC domain-containing protein YiiM